MKSTALPSLPLLLLLPFFCSSCSNLAKRHSQLSHQLREESRALTSAVVDTLQLQPESLRDLYSTTALHFARQDQWLEGLPAPATAIAVEPLLQTNEPARQLEAERELATRFGTQNSLMASQREIERKLIEVGKRKEAEENARKIWWWKRSSLFTLVLGSLIALFVIFPVLIPLAGRFLGWVVARIPALASAVGVVSVKAFDAVVRGIEKTKATPQTVDLANTSSGAREQGQFMEMLENNLSRQMDQAHKHLVRSRRAKLTTSI